MTSGGEAVHGVSHPGRVHHAFWSARGARGVHDEQRVAERKLLELQLGQLIQLVAAGRQEVVDEDAEKVGDGCQIKENDQNLRFRPSKLVSPSGFSLLSRALCVITTHLLGILERSVSCLERA